MAFVALLEVAFQARPDGFIIEIAILTFLAVNSIFCVFIAMFNFRKITLII